MLLSIREHKVANRQDMHILDSISYPDRGFMAGNMIYIKSPL